MKLFHCFVFLAIYKGVFGAKQQDPECKFVNTLLKQEATFDCCGVSGITCEDSHIVEMYLL